MTPQEARHRVYAETLDAAGLLVVLRMGDDPGPERMTELLQALEVLRDDLVGAAVLERELAHALHLLAVEPAAQVESWQRNGRHWRPALVTQEIPALCVAVEAVLSGE